MSHIYEALSWLQLAVRTRSIDMQLINLFFKKTSLAMRRMRKTKGEFVSHKPVLVLNWFSKLLICFQNWF
jgi:hypothetical protein